LMMSLWDALRMNMMISYQELVRTFLRLNSSLIERQVYQGNQQPSLFDAQYTSSIANTTNHGIHWLDGNKQVIE
ncbi:MULTISPECIES: hypothetical protein, partial [Klebsiella]|uniref:hypothetical protein n=1 Tax=Klebsiella TaxID=570 RepID=UPI0022405477